MAGKPTMHHPFNDYGLDVDTQDLNSTDSLGYRLKFAFEIGKEAELLLDFHGSEADQTPVGFAHMGYLDPTTGDKCSIKRIHAGECTSNTFGTTGVAKAGGQWGPEHVSSSISGVSAKLTMSLTDDIELTSITALEKMDKFLQDDGDGVGLSGVGFNVFFDEQYRSDTKQITQELLLNGTTEKTKWVTGLYYYDDSRQMRTQNQQVMILLLQYLLVMPIKKMYYLKQSLGQYLVNLIMILLKI